jgi:hypothetical protein
MNSRNEKIEVLSKELQKLKDKTFKVFFFVYDTKGTPSGSLTYIYQTASYLKELGYDVQMLYTEEEFNTPESWLNSINISELPHFNIQKDKIEVSAADFLFIPEIFADVMAKTKEMPCKRVAILQNYDFMTELIPVGASWSTLKINDCVTTSKYLGKRLNEVFKNVNVNVVRPCVDEIFNEDNTDKKLIVNIVSKDQNDLNAIVKPFKWKYPMCGFVPFRYVNGQDKETFARLLKESAITVWNDPFTDFGISALEAMACGNVVIGKIPEGEPEWLIEDGKVKDNGVWYYNTKDSHALIASVVQTFMRDNLPEEVLKEMKNTVKQYRPEKQRKDIEKVYVDTLFANRVKELQTVLDYLNKNNTELNSEN